MRQVNVIARCYRCTRMLRVIFNVTRNSDIYEVLYEGTFCYIVTDCLAEKCYCPQEFITKSFSDILIGVGFKTQT